MLIQCSQKNILYIVLAKFCLFGSKIENHIFSEKSPEAAALRDAMLTSDSDWSCWYCILLNNKPFKNRICSLYVLVVLCMYWWSCIFGGPSLACPPVCRCWAAVGPTAWFADVEPTLDRPLGLPTLSRRWTDCLVCRRWADVGPLDKITSDRQLLSPAGRQSDQRRSNGGPTATCYLGYVAKKHNKPLPPKMVPIG